MATTPPTGTPTVLTPSSSFTVLSRTSKTDIGTLTLLSSLAQTNQTQMQQKAEEVSAKYNSEISSNQADAERWKRVVGKIGAATTFISETMGRVKQMLTQVDSLTRTVNKADLSANADPGTNFDGYAAAFDSMVRGLVNTAKQGDTTKVNLLGSGEASFSYLTDTGTQTATVEGHSLASDYKIIDDDGKKWVPDRELRLLVQYDLSTGEKTGTSVSMRTGLELTSINTSTGALQFATNPDYVDARHDYTNSQISRTGLGLMDAWLYDGLTTDAGRARAAADLKTVRATLKLEVARYEGAMAMASFYEARAQKEVSTNKDEANTAILDRAKAVQKVQEDFNRQFENIRTQVSGAAVIRQKYLAMFGNTGLTKTLLNFYA